ncbi:helix-turn-helix domain-containing protein [Geobacter grbiciae]|uniref:helix-turn-helix domain-containing protein n=1 Tax=Geobacter grbiciae TaxID=155042 RepID=UPI001C025E13|nr:helix-turn-helix transcriptional regulator [Geobacter grbiciae]MBT1074459.1 helix-turn-helix transcriptional regulator [Geobacter grbiciae]
MVEQFLKSVTEKGLKQEDIQRLTGLTQSYISRLLRGATPSLETVIKLADVFGVSTDEVLGRKPKA